MLKTFSGRRASQNEIELRAMIDLFKRLGVKSYLEIGARHGDTFHEVMINLDENACGLAVDLPGALWGTKSSVSDLMKANEDLCAEGYNSQTLFGDSGSQQTIDAVKYFAPFDAILIDGDHTLSGVKRDYINYKSMAKKVICFHDIVGRGEMEKVTRQSVEVPIFWEGVKHEYRPADIVEFVAPDSKMGIGCILL